MRQLFKIVMLGLISVQTFSQTIKDITPKIGWIPDVSIKAQNEFERRNALSAKSSLSHAEQIELDKLTTEYHETTESIWDIIGEGCSWYCSGGPYKIVASSFLPKQGDNEYTGKKAHDLSLKTAWVEGVKGYGEGQYVEYYFTNESPRITEIKIFNGYIKSEKAWAENARVKKLKVSVNGKDFAILNLADTPAQQNFKIEPLGKRPDGKDLILRFTILEIYKGSTYDDTCITEIYFDGLDVHCFARGTKISINLRSIKNIEDLRPGDSVLTFDEKNKNFYVDIVERVENVKHHNLIKYLFADGSLIVATQDHPFLIHNKGWSSYKPQKTQAYRGFETAQQINIGDQFIQHEINGSTKLTTLKSIEVMEGIQDTFTISKLKKGNSFIANGLIVGVEETLHNP